MDMKEVGGSEHSGAVGGFSDSSSRKLLSSSRERKRPRVVLSDSESNDELSEPIRRKVDKFGTESVGTSQGSMGNEDFQTEKRVKNGLDISNFDQSYERRIPKDVSDDGPKLMLYSQNVDQRESGGGSTRMTVDDKKSIVLRSKSSGYAVDGDGDDEFNLPLSVSNENDEEDFDERVRLQGKNGVLKVMVNKDKLVGVSCGGNGREETEVRKESRTGVLDEKMPSSSRNIGDLQEDEDIQGSRSGDGNKKRVPMQSASSSGLKCAEKPIASKSNKEGKLKLAKAMRVPSTAEVVKDGTINACTENVTKVKGKESKMKRASCTEKQLLREKIKNMLLGAGWTIDYRPRRNRDYLDSVYISPAGTGYWSITKAYDALRKEDKDSLKGGGDFTPLPNEILSKLTRQTRKKMEREMQKNRKLEGNNKKSKRVRLRKSAHQAAGDQHKEKLGSNMRHNRKSSESRLKETRQNSGDYLSDNSGKETPWKDGAMKTTVRTNSHIVQGRKSIKIGRRTLLVRDSDKGLSLENNGFIQYSGKRTLLSWLIDTGTVSEGEKVQYMNLRKTRVMQDGWITRDGIHCGCCSKILTILRFELHAGSKLGQPVQNTFISSGQSLLQCQIDAWNKQDESERKGFHAVDVDGDDPNDDTCCLCGDGGDLICCDGCPSTFHLSCLDMQMLPQGDWHCPNCACKYCEIAGGICTKASGRTESSLLTCHLCEKKYHKSCSPEMDDIPIDSNDLNFPFCGQKCRELYSNLQKLLWIKHELASGFSWSLIQRSDPLPDVSSVNFSQRVECNSKIAVALLVMDECFLPIVDRRSGINLIHNVLYNCGSNFSRLNYGGFFTAILERGDEMICAASIRIHGTQLAEMPFIGTRHMYRRQGMCRRLLHAIESALASLKVEKLVIPAIEEHMHTWTNAFGFSPLEESSKQEMRSVNMLVFPGTDMLQKPLMKQGTLEGNITSVEGEKGAEIEDCNNPATKKSDLNDSVMPNGDYSIENHSEPEIPTPGKKPDAQSDTNVLKVSMQDRNPTNEETAGAGSGSKVEKIHLQNGNETGIGITDSDSVRSQALDSTSHDTIYVSHEHQLEVTAKGSNSIDEHSHSVVQNGNVTLQAPRVPLERDVGIPFQRDVGILGTECAYVDAHSVSVAKENDVQVGMSDSIADHCTR